MCGPLSVEYMTIVSLAMPRSSIAFSTVPTLRSWSIMTSAYSPFQRPAWPMLSGLGWVRKCMCVKLTQTNMGFPAFTCLPMNSAARAAMSSSIVSMRFFVSGPVSSIFWVPSGRAQLWTTPRGPYFLRKFGKSFGLG
jgi:hypothetical protein